MYLARTLGFDAEESGELADAVRLLTIAYELTYDEELEPVLDDLKRRMRKEETKAAKKRRPLSPAQRRGKKRNIKDERRRAAGREGCFKAVFAVPSPAPVFETVNIAKI